MGIVTEHLRSLVAKHVSDRGVVVWYDPERHYASLVDSLILPQTYVARYTDSFFALRHEIEDRYSFADLELVVNESARNALQTRQPIGSRHIEDAFSRLPPSITIEVIEDMSRE